MTVDGRAFSLEPLPLVGTDPLSDLAFRPSGRITADPEISLISEFCPELTIT